jgi:4'-phosphopantetheinyl transferase
VDVFWLEQRDIDVPFGEQWLCGGERAHLAGLRIPKRRADWRLGRWTAKRAVSVYLNLSSDPESLTAIELRPAPSGAPQVFLRGEPAPIAISLSHSCGTGLCAVAPAGADVGCDLETVEPRSPAFLADYFTGEEQQFVAQTPAAHRDRMLTLLWSAKESALKALGCGLRLDTISLNATPLSSSGEEWNRLSVSQIGGKVFHGWWRESRDQLYTVVADPPPLHLFDQTPRD